MSSPFLASALHICSILQNLLEASYGPMGMRERRENGERVREPRRGRERSRERQDEKDRGDGREIHQLTSLSGQGVMIVTNTGRMIITNSGKIILKHIAVEHPIARYIVNSIQGFHERYGDGCVSLVLALHASVESV